MVCHGYEVDIRKILFCETIAKRKFCSAEESVDRWMKF